MMYDDQNKTIMPKKCFENSNNIRLLQQSIESEVSERQLNHPAWVLMNHKIHLCKNTIQW